MEGNKNMIALTPTAKAYLLQQCKMNDKKYIKLTVKGGGCAGFSYDYQYVDSAESLDINVALDEEYAFIVDGSSLMHIIGTEIDYVSDIAGSSLVLKNPNQTSSCGCGKSFAI